MSNDKGDNSKSSPPESGSPVNPQPVDINRMRVRLLVVCAFERNLDTALTYLSRRGWHPHVTTKLIEAFQQISVLNPNFVLISINLQSNKLDKLAQIIFQTFQVPVITYSEKGDPFSIKRFQDVPANFKIPGIVSGPSIHRGIKNYLHELANSEDQKFRNIFQEIVRSNRNWKNHSLKKSEKKSKKGYTFSTEDESGPTKLSKNQKYLNSLDEAEIAELKRNSSQSTVSGQHSKLEDVEYNAFESGKKEESLGKIIRLDETLRGRSKARLNEDGEAVNFYGNPSDQKATDNTDDEELNEFSRVEAKSDLAGSSVMNPTNFDEEEFDLAKLAQKYYEIHRRDREQKEGESDDGFGGITELAGHDETTLSDRSDGPDEESIDSDFGETSELEGHDETSPSDRSDELDEALDEASIGETSELAGHDETTLSDRSDGPDEESIDADFGETAELAANEEISSSSDRSDESGEGKIETPINKPKNEIPSSKNELGMLDGPRSLESKPSQSKKLENLTAEEKNLKNLLMSLAEKSILESKVNGQGGDENLETSVWTYRSDKEFGLVLTKVVGTSEQSEVFNQTFKKLVNSYIQSKKLNYRLGDKLSFEAVDFEVHSEGDVFNICLYGDSFCLEMKYIKIDVAEADLMSSKHTGKLKINPNELVETFPHGADLYIYLPANNRFIRYLGAQAKLSEKNKKVLCSSDAYINEVDSNSFKDSLERNKMLSQYISKKKKSA